MIMNAALKLGRLLDALEMYSLCSLLLALHSQCEGPGIEEVEGDTRYV